MSFVLHHVSPCFNFNYIEYRMIFYTVNIAKVIQNTVQKDQCHQDEGGIVPETSYCTIALSVKMEKQMFENIFFKLLKKHVGKNHEYHKIFNKSNMKVSYTSMNNMTKIINSHKKYVASKKVQANQKFSSCCNLENCPFDSKCLTSKQFILPK